MRIPYVQLRRILIILIRHKQAQYPNKAILTSTMQTD